MDTKWLVVLLVSVGASTGRADAQTPELTFAGEARFAQAIEEYEEVWRTEGERITEVLQQVSGLTFSLSVIGVEVIEGPSWAGTDAMGMRASYSADTKRATLVHELGHILIGDLVPEDAPPRSTPTPHYLLFLFLYDTWVQLWGTEFANEQVQVESARRGGVDYEGTWEAVLRNDRDARAAELREIVTRYSRDPSEH